MPEWADPYYVAGTDVLENKPGLRNEGVLRTFEYEQTALRIAELRAKPVEGKFDLQHLQKIHAHIFQDVYHWAGQVRIVNLSKGGTSFTKVPQIGVDAAALANSLQRENHLQGLDKPKFVERLSHYYARFNQLHPFREGNGRSTREFIGQLARQAGYELDQTRIDNAKDQWNEAARRSAGGDLAGVKEVFAQAIRPSRALAFEKLPEREALQRHPELQPAYDQLRLLGEQLAERHAGNQKAQALFTQQARSEILRKLDAGQVIAPQRALGPQPAPERQWGRAPDHLLVIKPEVPGPQPAYAKAFQAVAEQRLERDTALKLYPQLRHAFNELAIASVKHAREPQRVATVRDDLQRELNAGRVPQPVRAVERSRDVSLQR